MRVSRAGCRLLGEGDRPAVAAVLDADPLGSILVASRVEVSGLDPWHLGAEVWGYGSPAALAGVCYAGANLVPVTGSRQAVAAFAERALRQGRRCSSIDSVLSEGAIRTNASDRVIPRVSLSSAGPRRVPAVHVAGRPGTPASYSGAHRKFQKCRISEFHSHRQLPKRRVGGEILQFCNSEIL